MTDRIRAFVQFEQSQLYVMSNVLDRIERDLGNRVVAEEPTDARQMQAATPATTGSLNPA